MVRHGTWQAGFSQKSPQALINWASKALQLQVHCVYYACLSMRACGCACYIYTVLC